MEIDSEWIVDYIKKKGLRIIIPKEATVIKSEALDSSIIHYECPEYDEDTLEEKVTVEFEQGSALEKIEPFAFRGVGAGKDIEIPKSVKTIGDCAFYGQGMTRDIEYAVNAYREIIDGGTGMVGMDVGGDERHRLLGDSCHDLVQIFCSYGKSC